MPPCHAGAAVRLRQVWPLPKCPHAVPEQALVSVLALPAVYLSGDFTCGLPLRRFHVSTRREAELPALAARPACPMGGAVVSIEARNATIC